jgi:hypothetical protein
MTPNLHELTANACYYVTFIQSTAGVHRLQELADRLFSEACAHSAGHSRIEIDGLGLECHLPSAASTTGKPRYTVRARHSIGMLEAEGESLHEAYAHIREALHPELWITNDMRTHLRALLTLRQRMKDVEVAERRAEGHQLTADMRLIPEEIQLPASIAEVRAEGHQLTADARPIPEEIQPCRTPYV